MSKNHSKRKKARANLPKKKGQKRCPFCMCNTKINGHCSTCDPVMDSMDWVDDADILAPIALTATYVAMKLAKRKKKEKQEE